MSSLILLFHKKKRARSEKLTLDLLLWRVLDNESRLKFSGKFQSIKHNHYYNLLLYNIKLKLYSRENKYYKTDHFLIIFLLSVFEGHLKIE